MSRRKRVVTANRPRRAWPDVATAAALAGLSLAAYVRTAAPSVAAVFDDTLEFQVVTYTLGIAHPTGYPLYTLLGRAFMLLPWGEPAFRANLMSAVFAALAVALVYAACRQLRCSRAAAAVGALSLGPAPVFWSQATIAEVYTLHAALLMLVVWLALRAGAAKEARRSAGVTVAAAAVAFGLGLTHHRMMLLLVPPLIWHLWLMYGRLLSPRRWARLALLVAAPLLLYAYLPLRGMAVSSLDGSYVNTLDGLVRHVSASGYNVFLSGNPLALERWSLGRYAGFFHEQLGVVGLALAAAGAVALWRQRRQRQFLGSALLLNLAFAAAYRVADKEVFFIPAIALMAVLVGLGLEGVAGALAGSAGLRRAGRAAVGAALPALALAVMLAPLPGRWPHLDRSHEWAVHDMGRAWLEAVEPEATVVGILGETTLMRYFQVTAGLRRDVDLVAADDEVVRLDTVRWLVRRGLPTYLTRPLPGAAEEFALDAAGPLIRVSPRGAGLSEGVPGDLVAPGLYLHSHTVTATEEHGRAGVAIAVNWSATAEVEDDLRLSARLLRHGWVVAVLDGDPVHNAYPSRHWAAGAEAGAEMIADYYHVHLPVGDAGGATEVVLVLYRGGDGREVARRSLGEVEVAPGSGPRPLAEWGARPLAAWLGGYRLLGANLPPRLRVSAGQSLAVDLLWANPGAPATAELATKLVLAAGQTRFEAPAVLAHEGWQRGRLLRQTVHFEVPARLESGVYRLELAPAEPGWLPFRVLGWPPLASHYTLARLEVSGRSRSFDPPRPAYPVDVTFTGPQGQVARLLGYDWQRRGAELRVELYWQALAESPERLKVFLHGVDEGGTVVAQSDAEPAAGTAPTNSWIGSEYVTDTHVLALPTDGGPLRLWVGLYGDGGRRLTPLAGDLPTAQEAVLLLELEP